MTGPPLSLVALPGGGARPTTYQNAPPPVQTVKTWKVRKGSWLGTPEKIATATPATMVQNEGKGKKMRVLQVAYN